MSEANEIIYVLSNGHSGSTLLDLLLGSHRHIESVGEVKKYLDYLDEAVGRPTHQRFCTCGAFIDDCAYWNKIRSALWDRLGTDRIDLRAEPLEEFERANYELFRAVGEMTARRYICDSSKDFHRLAQMLDSSLFNVYILHLVRDGRAVAQSYRRKGANLHRQVLQWQTSNLAFRRKLRRSANYQLVRYEDLVSAPAEVLTQILEPLGLEFEHEQLAFWRHEHHNLSGNRMRNQGNQAIQRDTTYLQELSWVDWTMSTALAGVGLTFFGYPLRKR